MDMFQNTNGAANAKAKWDSGTDALSSMPRPVGVPPINHMRNILFEDFWMVRCKTAQFNFQEYLDALRIPCLAEWCDAEYAEGWEITHYLKMVRGEWFMVIQFIDPKHRTHPEYRKPTDQELLDYVDKEWPS